jgi:hypothetical protein
MDEWDEKAKAREEKQRQWENSLLTALKTRGILAQLL